MMMEINKYPIHTVKRAIVLAAGKGKRMLPLTLEIPKPLVRVNGVRMIDTVINGLHKNDIFEIYVVVGYMKEKFYKWREKYPDVKIVENPYFDDCNNISSIYVIRDKLEECIILDGDQIIYNPKILDIKFSLSGYNAVWREEQTNEWMMEVSGGLVQSCSRNGGSRGWQLYSVSRWTREDGNKLKHHIEKEFETGNRDIYWDDVPMFCHFSDYKLGIHEMDACDIIEIDDLDELSKIDRRYEAYINP